MTRGDKTKLLELLDTAIVELEDLDDLDSQDVDQLWSAYDIVNAEVPVSSGVTQ